MYQNCIGRFNERRKDATGEHTDFLTFCTAHIQHEDKLVPVFDFAEE
jgi:hypothetical protein